MTRLRSQTGQTSAEYMGILLVLGAVILAVSLTSLDTRIAGGINTAICRIIGAGCEGGEGATQSADGRPQLSDCVTDSAQRGISGRVKVAIVKFGAGVEGLKEVSADDSTKVTIRANAEAGLEFATPTADVQVGDEETGAGKRELSLTGNGQYGRTWKFKTEAEADKFIEDVTKKAKAKADFMPNFPGTKDDADIELPQHEETTYAGGVEVRAKGQLGGTGLEGNVGAGVGATFNDNKDSKDYGDKTYFFKLNGGLEGSAEAGIFDLGAAGAGETKVAVTYDRAGQPKKMKVIGQLDISATAELAGTMDGKDLDQFVKGAKEGSGSIEGKAGRRMVFEAELPIDAAHPENRAAADAFISGRDADGRTVSRLGAAGDLYDRFKADATINGRLYELDQSKSGAGLDVGVFEVGGEMTSEDARLIDAYYRDKRDGGFKRWEDCVRSRV